MYFDLICDAVKQERKEIHVPHDMTADDWNKFYPMLKSILKDKPPIRLRHLRSSEHSEADLDYVSFLNSISLNIKRKETEYCYRIDQVADIYRIIGDRLYVVWDSELQCFELSLIQA